MAAVWHRGGWPGGERNTEAVSQPAGPTQSQSAPAPAAAPERIIVPAIELNTPIVVPASTDLEVLNEALTKGVVQYPGSAEPGSRGNIFLFGHSTGFRVVRNPAYQVFSRLKELKSGDILRLAAGGREYWYRVTTVTLKPASLATVDFRPTGDRRLLTLSTCNVFGQKDDRYIVEAEFVKSYPLRSYASASGTSS